MTEKRFYYNVFYHADDMSRVMEYEIIDKQSYPNYPNHDEKEDIPDWVIYIGENDSGWQDMLVDLLNKLHEEIQKCKEYNGILYANHTKNNRELVKQISELKQENEQLKNELKVYRKVVSCSNCKYHDYDWDIDDGYGGEEYEVCDKGNDVTEGICEDWEEL